MTDPGSSMSLTAIIVMAVVVLAALAGWLGAVFFAARASQPEARRHPGDVPAAPARVPGGDGTGGALTGAGRGG